MGADAVPRAPALRVGSVPYLVGRPLDAGLEDEPEIELARAVPAELVRRLRAEEVDVALVSSIEMFRRPGYRYLAGPAVASRGPIASVQVFLRRPLASVRSLALDPASRAAAALVQVLLAGQGVEFVEVEAGCDPREAGCDAWLRIGDTALREAESVPAASRFDPARAWLERTGRGFVFAVWLVRPGAAVEPHLPAFARARARGAAAIDALARAASASWRLPEASARRYLLEECRFDLGPEAAESLALFQREAARLGLCSADARPEPIAMPEPAPHALDVP